MNEDTMQAFATTAERLAGAAEVLERVLGRMEAQQEELSAKIDRIVAAVEERVLPMEQRSEVAADQELGVRVAELERANTDLKAQASRMARKTLSPLVSALLGKFEYEGGEGMESAVLDKTLTALSVEQRIAVKAEMARAGLLK